MFKKLFTVTVLCMGLMAMAGIQEAKAWPRVVGTPTLSKKCLIIDTIWAGVGDEYIIEYEFIIDEIQAACINPADQDGGVSEPVPYSLSDPISAEYEDLLGLANLIEKGKAELKTELSNLVIYDALFCTEFDVDELNEEGNPLCIEYVFPSGICVNDNWSIVPDPLEINKTTLLIKCYEKNDAGEKGDLVEWVEVVYALEDGEYILKSFLNGDWKTPLPWPYCEPDVEPDCCDPDCDDPSDHPDCCDS